ncbi:hypothetical protein [Paenibacillus silvae]|uniref:Uncharacterized protein n=1 Tax=Paenibacillus silvae TaxID=1325358 RepID=A0A2W6NNT5_9BACL|nr:hypothetical protein [Paenibacillus silvae]PZT57491.1 hypothetical protein DN757_02215 [Paenibacillus silvae]
MSTSYNVLYDSFFALIEKDIDFFLYNNVSNEEAMQIAKNRAKGYLVEAITKFKISCSSDLTLNLDDENEELSDTLTTTEINLLSSLMREKYFERDFSLLKAFQLQFSPKDLQVFSPANERKTFMDMFESIKKENRVLMDNYSSRDRLTGRLKTIDYSKYQNE